MEAQKIRHATKEPTHCEECGASPIAVVQRGLPVEYDSDAVERGELIYGGCIILDNQPRWQCSHCGCGYLDLSDGAD